MYVNMYIYILQTLIKVQWLSAIGHQPSPPWLCPATLAQMEMIHGIKNISKEGVRRYEAIGGSWRLGCRVWWCWRNAGMVRDWIGVRYRGFGLPMVSAQFFFLYILNPKCHAWDSTFLHRNVAGSSSAPWHSAVGSATWSSAWSLMARRVGQWLHDNKTARHLGVRRSSKLAVTKFLKRVKTLVTFLMHSNFFWTPIKRDWWRRKTSAICKTSVYLRQLYSSISSKIVILCKKITRAMVSDVRRMSMCFKSFFFGGFTLIFTFTGSCFKLENHIQDTTKIWKQIIIIAITMSCGSSCQQLSFLLCVFYVIVLVLVFLFAYIVVKSRPPSQWIPWIGRTTLNLRAFAVWMCFLHFLTHLFAQRWLQDMQCVFFESNLCVCALFVSNINYLYNCQSVTMRYGWQNTKSRLTKPILRISSTLMYSEYFQATNKQAHRNKHRSSIYTNQLPSWDTRTNGETYHRPMAMAGSRQETKVLPR